MDIFFNKPFGFCWARLVNLKGVLETGVDEEPNLVMTSDLSPWIALKERLWLRERTS